MDILEFQGEHRWLSNFWPAKVALDGMTYQSVEHAYQAAKTNPSEREPFLHCTAAEAKQLGRGVSIQSGWDDQKVAVMRSLIEQKFAPGSTLAEKLIATGKVRIIEGNHWGDTFWGVCRGNGRNLLGEILMERRAALLRHSTKIEVIEHPSPSYSPRTYANAKSADLTVAFAVDFTTAGEKLTHKAAGDRYVGIPLSEDPIQAARLLYKALRDRDAHSLNVAGNGIYTLAKHGWTQARTNDYVHAVLAKVHEHWPLKHVRSGGQTGVDIAGVTAAFALGIDVTALLPKGFVQRAADKIDRQMTADNIRLQIEAGADSLSPIKATGNQQPTAQEPKAIAQKALFDTPVTETTSGNKMGHVRVVSKRQGGTRAEPGEHVIDGDRKSPVFGNRHYLSDWKDPVERERVIKNHLIEDFEPDALKGGPIFQEMQNLAERVRHGEDLAISCWCAPLPCHCDHIAEGVRILAAGGDLKAKVQSDIDARQFAPVPAKKPGPSL